MSPVTKTVTGRRQSARVEGGKERERRRDATDLLLVENEVGKPRLGDLSGSSRSEESSKMLEEDEELDEDLTSEGDVCELRRKDDDENEVRFYSTGNQRKQDGCTSKANNPGLVKNLGMNTSSSPPTASLFTSLPFPPAPPFDALPSPVPRRTFSFSVSAARVVMTRSTRIWKSGNGDEEEELVDEEGWEGDGGGVERRVGLAKKAWRDQKVL